MTITMPDPTRTPGEDPETGLFPVAAVSAGCRVAELPIRAMRIGRRGVVGPADSSAGLAPHGVILAVRRPAPLGRRSLPALRRLGGGGQ